MRAPASSGKKINENHSTLTATIRISEEIGIKQQQQHNFFPQASWGRLEVKPKRNKSHGSGTLIASLQALLSKAISLEIF